MLFTDEVVVAGFGVFWCVSAVLTDEVIAAGADVFSACGVEEVGEVFLVATDDEVMVSATCSKISVYRIAAIKLQLYVLIKTFGLM